MFTKTVRIVCLLSVLLGLAYGATADQLVGSEPIVGNQALSSDLQLSGCLVKLQHHYKLSAEASGVLVSLPVKEGDAVTSGQVIGQIDDRKAKLQIEVTRIAALAALKRAKDDIDIKFSKKAAEVAKADYEQDLEALKMTAKSVTATEVRRHELEWQKSLLSIEKSENDRKLAEYDYWTKKAEHDAAQVEIDQRVIHAKDNSVVEKLYRRQNEWVNPGDELMQLIRLDSLLVEGAVNVSEYNPNDLLGKNVTVEVRLAHGKMHQLTGRIARINPNVRGDGKYVVQAEVANVNEKNQWILRPKMTVKMTIHLGN